MTSTRRTNLFRITAVEDVDVPVLSIGLIDLQESTSQAFTEIRDNHRVVGNGTFRASFGEGVSFFYFSKSRTLLITFLHGYPKYAFHGQRSYNHKRRRYPPKCVHNDSHRWYFPFMHN